MEGTEVEYLAEEGPAIRDVCDEDGYTGFTDIPECPLRREGLCEGVVFV